MAKGKSNPKTLEHVKRMTKQRRSEQAEGTALEAATQAAQAVDRKKKTRKGRRGDVSSDDDLFRNFVAIREAYVPELDVWVGEYPFLDRNGFVLVSKRVSYN